MHPELEALIRAYEAMLEDRDDEASAAADEFERLLNEALSKQRHISREGLLTAVKLAYLRWVHANRKPPTLPPKA